jgi:hypothetical protein
MAIRIRSKNSVVKDKAPLPADLEIGELALNAHQDSPAIYLKDAAGAVRKVAGADAVGDKWTRTGTELSPKTAGDSVFTSGAVKVGGTTAAPTTVIQADGTVESKGGIGFVVRDAANPTTVWANLRSNTLVFDGPDFRFASTSGSTPVAITSAGDFLLGGTLPASPNVKLGADGKVGATGYLIVRNGVQTGFVSYDPQTNAPTQGSVVVVNLGNNGAGAPNSGVGLQTGATAWTPSVSESRLKDIQSDADTDQCWDLIRDIELKRYYYKDQDDKTGISYMGPMADWLGLQDPELLIDTGRTDEHGKIHTYNQGLLDMKALAALSAGLKRIEALETEVAALKAASTHTP